MDPQGAEGVGTDPALEQGLHPSAGTAYRQVQTDQSELCPGNRYFYLKAAVNGYFIYDGVLDVIVLRGVKKEVEGRKDFFYKRIEHKRDQVLALIEEL